MFAFILASAFLVVCPSAIAITLPNGFVFDETQYLQLEPRANYALEKCERTYDGCSSDCSASLYCDEFGNVQSSYACDSYSPYCVKGTGTYASCGKTFPMTNQACFTKAMTSFVCTGDGEFADPNDCSKYHVCNGTAHQIVECPSHHQYLSDASDIYNTYTDPGTGAFSCRFKPNQYACQCDSFYCSPNTFGFRYSDAFHYAYCLEIGTLKRTIIFKCPAGTRHQGMASATNTVDCVPIGTPMV